MLNRNIDNALRLFIRRSPLAGLFRSLLHKDDFSEIFKRAKRDGWDSVVLDLLINNKIELSNKIHLKLRNEVNQDIQTEQFLTSIRRNLLFAGTHYFTQQKNIEIHNTLILQSNLNQYVWFADDEENIEIKRLENKLINQDEDVSWIDVSKYLLYKRPDGELLKKCEVFKHKLKDQKWLISYLETEAGILKTHQEYKNKITRFATIENEQSKLVAGNYESYPYPPWTRLQNEHPVPRTELLKKYFADEELEFQVAPFDVLVAGCGTGSKAIEYAISYGKHATVTAVDLSMTSLAYAARMADHYGVDINFIQIDLLDLGNIGKKFHIVECTGVLHHMQDPVAGGKALVASLAPRGILHISLYSRSARRSLFDIRNRYHLSPDFTDDQVRAFRRTIMMEEPELIDEGISLRWDFFDLISCRDLLFHPLEHCFNLPEIGDFLNQINVEFSLHRRICG